MLIAVAPLFCVRSKGGPTHPAFPRHPRLPASIDRSLPLQRQPSSFLSPFGLKAWRRCTLRPRMADKMLANRNRQHAVSERHRTADMQMASAL